MNSRHLIFGLIAFQTVLQAKGQEEFWQDDPSDYTDVFVERSEATLATVDALDEMMKLVTKMQLQDGDCSPIVEIDSRAREGDASQQLFLAELHYQGLCVAQDDARAFSWLERAASQNLHEAQLMLSGVYYLGRGVEVDISKTIEWATKATEGPQPFEALTLLGALYSDEDQVIPDYVKAENYLQKAFEIEDPLGSSACRELVNVQLKLALEEKSISTMKEGAIRGDNACQFMSALTLSGTGSREDELQALKWTYIALTSDLIAGNDAAREVLIENRDSLLTRYDSDFMLEAQSEAADFTPESRIKNEANLDTSNALLENAEALLSNLSIPNNTADAQALLNDLGVKITRKNFFDAITIDALQTVKLFIAAGAGINVEHPYDFGYTPLIYAVDFDAPNVFKFLLNAGAEIDLAAVNGNTALTRALAHDRTEMRDQLLERGADASKRSQADSDIIVPAALSYALFNENPVLIKRLIQLGASVNETYINGDTALHMAAADEWPDNVAALLESGADPNVLNMYGLSPLDQALSKEEPQEISSEIVQLLLAAGANPNGGMSKGFKPLFMSAFLGRADVVESLLNVGADVNYRYFLPPERVPVMLNNNEKEIVMNGGTPLMLAVSKDNFAAARSLLAFGAGKNFSIKIGNRDVDVRALAQEKGNSLMLEILGF